MTVVAYPLDVVSSVPTYTGQMTRQALSALFGSSPTGRSLGAKSGASPGTPTTTVTATATVWTVAPHSGVLDLETAVTAGPIAYAVTANETGSVTAASASNPRIDVISLQQNDPAMSDGSSVPGVTVQYTAGTAAATPAVPPPANNPSRNMVIAQISVPKSGSGSPSVTWVAPYTVAAGGIIPTTGAGQYPAVPYVGQYIDDASLGLLRWNGTTWARPGGSPTWTPLYIPGGAQANSFGYTPAYFLDPITGKVELRGNLAKSSGGWGAGATVIYNATWPAAIRPAQLVEVTVATTNSVDAAVRLEISPTGVVTVLVPPASGGNPTWFSFDGICYWTT